MIQRISPRFHFLLLAAALIFGTALRFTALDRHPLWMDEAITALFSTGNSYYDVPLEQPFSLAALNRVFQFQPTTTCAAIVESVAKQSVHPPLFFCWLHSWLSWLPAGGHSGVWKLRALPALFGVGTIAAVYLLNRVAFSRTAGLLAAWLMAVSPFAVYLSQEARHYTLPMLLVTLALIGLIRIQQDLQQQRLNPAIWLGWVAINGLGFYVHYLCLLATIAQVGALAIGLMRQSGPPRLANRSAIQPGQVTLPPAEGLRPASSQRPTPLDAGGARPSLVSRLKAELLTLTARLASQWHNLTQFQRYSWFAWVGAIAGLMLMYAPWLPLFWGHITSPETDWMKPFEPHPLTAIAPLYQLPIGWLFMLVGLPLAGQPLWLTIPTVLLIIIFGIWMGLLMWGGLRRLLMDPRYQGATLMLVSFIGIVLVEFLATALLLQKDITQAPRYNFIYYPAMAALLGSCLWQEIERPIALPVLTISAGRNQFSTWQNQLRRRWRDAEGPLTDPEIGRSPQVPDGLQPTKGQQAFANVRAQRMANFLAARERDLAQTPAETHAENPASGRGMARYQTTPVNQPTDGARQMLAKLKAMVRNWPGRHWAASGQWATVTVIALGFISSLLVVSGLVLQKPYQPDFVAQEMTRVPGKSLVVMADMNYQDVALGLSYALALQDTGRSDVDFAFMGRSGGYDNVFKKLAVTPLPGLKNLWLLGPGLRQREFPPQIKMAKLVCDQVPDRYNRIGIPYQGYRCKP